MSKELSSNCRTNELVLSKLEAFCLQELFVHLLFEPGFHICLFTSSGAFLT